MSEQEQTPAYRALYEKDLICNQYRVRHVADLDLIRGAGDITQSKITQCITCNGCCCLMSFFVVNSGCVRRGTHADGRYLFFGEGVHVLKTPYITVQGDDVPLMQASIVHGTKAIVTIGQGYVGLAMDRGQPVLLPPGLHQWDSPTIEFQRTIDLSSSLIQFGPYTLVTVDEGYAAVTQDNGEQKILDGGRAYMLTHRNWKFEKFMTKKLQTNDVGPIAVTTGDNVSLEAVATVNWLIEDAQLAARMAASTMASGRAQAATSGQGGQFDIGELQRGEQPRCLMQCTGEGLFVPAFWWRAMLNVGPAFAVGSHCATTEADVAYALKHHPASARALYQYCAATARSDPDACRENFKRVLKGDRLNFFYQWQRIQLLYRKAPRSTVRVAARLMDNLQRHLNERQRFLVVRVAAPTLLLLAEAIVGKPGPLEDARAAVRLAQAFVGHVDRYVRSVGEAGLPPQLQGILGAGLDDCGVPVPSKHDRKYGMSELDGWVDVAAMEEGLEKVEADTVLDQPAFERVGGTPGDIIEVSRDVEVLAFSDSMSSPQEGGGVDLVHEANCVTSGNPNTDKDISNLCAPPRDKVNTVWESLD